MLPSRHAGQALDESFYDLKRCSKQPDRAVRWRLVFCTRSRFIALQPRGAIQRAASG